MIAYKMMNSDMTCRGFQYKLGETYEMSENDIVICSRGFHASKHPVDCLTYYDNIKGDKRMFKVEMLGRIIEDNAKVVTNKIKILEEVDADKTILDKMDECSDIHKYNWAVLSSNMRLPEHFIEKHKKKLVWYLICEYQTLSEEFIEDHKYYIDFCDIFKYQKLSVDFLEKYSYLDSFNWSVICECQELSEEFIEKHTDEVVWWKIFKYQKLSREFISKHKDKIKLSLSIFKEHTIDSKIFEIIKNTPYK